MSVRNLTPAEVQTALESGQIHLIDVREDYEFEQARIAGSVNQPLSTFHPGELPQDGKEIIFMCAGGVRSLRAIEAAQAFGINADAHLAPGIRGWIAEGLPVEP
ncbi:rhodanese-like domain-containing protein [Asticcacaulis sp. BYS171W]|uniref:Rhodanese-like domain-containing protein n=1 Tax=Asticcacaulis aquaticus TaxID=2984212 RepID=A0ABT5HTK2_9CAUL|nr:rhodanese-like domain-containing protein [Asticcacaulis aquaticus]MDC7683395.1 rhodanese-like domain-containing protein [Asticcacaulis aquaticus]